MAEQEPAKTRKMEKIPAVVRQTHQSVLLFGQELRRVRADVGHMADALNSYLDRDKQQRQVIIELLKQVGGKPNASARGFLEELGMMSSEPLERAPKNLIG